MTPGCFAGIVVLSEAIGRSFQRTDIGGSISLFGPLMFQLYCFHSNTLMELWLGRACTASLTILAICSLGDVIRCFWLAARASPHLTILNDKDNLAVTRIEWHLDKPADAHRCHGET